MSAFPFTVGDKVRRNYWAKGTSIEITAIGVHLFLGVWPNGNEYKYDQLDLWLPA